MKVNILLSIIIVFFIFPCISFCQHDNNKESILTEEKSIKELTVIDSTFISILDNFLQKNRKCITYKKNLPWQIEINEVKNNFGKNIKSFYISRLYCSDYYINGDGYFVYKNILFMVRGEIVPEVFEYNSNQRVFNVYIKSRIFITDPPRCFYYYYDNRFFKGYIAPCG